MLIMTCTLVPLLCDCISLITVQVTLCNYGVGITVLRFELLKN